MGLAFNRDGGDVVGGRGGGPLDRKGSCDNAPRDGGDTDMAAVCAGSCNRYEVRIVRAGLGVVSTLTAESVTQLSAQPLPLHGSSWAEATCFPFDCALPPPTSVSKSTSPPAALRPPAY